MSQEYTKVKGIASLVATHTGMKGTEALKLVSKAVMYSGQITSKASLSVPGIGSVKLSNKPFVSMASPVEPKYPGVQQRSEMILNFYTADEPQKVTIFGMEDVQNPQESKIVRLLDSSEELVLCLEGNPDVKPRRRRKNLA